MFLVMFASATMAISAAGEAAYHDVAMFERLQLDDDLTVATYSIVRDTRCPDPELCFHDEKLMVIVIANQNGKWQEHRVTMGQPVPVANGWLTLTGTTAKAREGSAIPLSEYRLSYVFER